MIRTSYTLIEGGLAKPPLKLGDWWIIIVHVGVITLPRRVGSINVSGWRHQIEAFSALVALCAENSPVTAEFPAQSPVTRSFDVLFDLRLNKRLSKQSWGWWFETPSRPLWRHIIHPVHWATIRSRSKPIWKSGPIGNKRELNDSDRKLSGNERQSRESRGRSLNVFKDCPRFKRVGNGAYVKRKERELVLAHRKDSRDSRFKILLA